MKQKRLVCGILAHVDAGKTTLAEGILYLTGSIRKLGRVDHQDAFLDNFELERARGITIFSKQAEVALGEVPVTLMDTPGHVDFSAEMERTLQILDYAILVISGADGVQGHVETLWRLLERYQIPVFLFVNKMDQPGTDRGALMQELTKRLDGRCVDFTPLAVCSGSGMHVFGGSTAGTERSAEHTEAFVTEKEVEEFYENLAMCDEGLLERYLESGTVTEEEIAALIGDRKVFPCYFGSALKMQGVEELLDGIAAYGRPPRYGDAFGARVFKITRDAQGNRLTHMKITGGTLKVKDLLTNRHDAGAAASGNAKEGQPSAVEARTEQSGAIRAGAVKAVQHPGRPRAVEDWEQKVDQIRIYSGSSFRAVQEVCAGTVCAVTGLDHTYAGEGLGAETEAELPLLEPVLSYRIELPPECDVHRTFLQLRQLEEEEPELHIVWDEQLGEIHAQLMGEVQIEVLKNIIFERFGIRVEFGAGNIVYKETIAAPVEGVGHFEPLRHYAEVHLLLEPAERGSGLQFAAKCSEDLLDGNWQRLVLTHLEEKQHRGVLTGSEITDLHITLIAGRAHQKHTEGGDFRQATYRAVRQGLRSAESVLLEPVYEFRIEVPAESVGRAMTDIQKMCGSFEPPMIEGELAVISGTAPVVTMRGYQTELISYTKGRGRMVCALKGYEPCHNAQEVIAERGYDAEADLENPTGSVFCAHGAGFIVDWDEVRDYMHIDSGWRPGETAEELLESGQNTGRAWSRGGVSAEADGMTGYENTSDRIGYGAGFAGVSDGNVPDSSRFGNRSNGNPASGGRKRASQTGKGYSGLVADEKELEEIFARTYGAVPRERNRYAKSRRVEAPAVHYRAPRTEAQEEYLLVDGYNIIFAWEELRELAKTNIDAARDRLMDIMCNYQGYKKNHLILVFDAYKVAGGRGEVFAYHNIHVVYTKEAETADQYIEKTVRLIDKKYRVTVATSDALEQIIILGAGAVRMSAAGLLEETQRMEQEIRETYLNRQTGGKNYLSEHLDALNIEKEVEEDGKE
jgi:small GTP-binding protein